MRYKIDEQVDYIKAITLVIIQQILNNRQQRYFMKCGRVTSYD
ncbi:hypothetical protein [Nitrososphaera sp. AFS]|nr:hypothetical protein [Nitrososphaera sp. AFS]